MEVLSIFADAFQNVEQGGNVVEFFCISEAALKIAKQDPKFNPLVEYSHIWGATIVILDKIPPFKSAFACVGRNKKVVMGCL